MGMLQWVIWQGEAHHVREWAHLPPRARPKTTCPVCGQGIVLKLIGRRRTPHAAHRPGVQCATTHPETADHYNAKFALAAELRRVGRLEIAEHCREILPSVRKQPILRCTATRAREWLAGWDTVVVEAQLGSLRPDVQMLRGGEVIGAVEVLQTHAVPDEKKEALRLLGLPWLEVRASTILGQKPAVPWSAEGPLEVVREAPSRPWQCPEHAAARSARIHQEEVWQRTQVELEAQRQGSGPRRWWVRIVDFYFPSPPRRERFLYKIVEVYRAGELFEVRLGHNQRTKPVLTLGASDLVGRETRIEAAFQADCEERRRILGAIVDSPMEWVEVGSPTVGDNGGTSLFTQEFPDRYALTDGGWSLRPEMTNLRWGRP